MGSSEVGCVAEVSGWAIHERSDGCRALLPDLLPASELSCRNSWCDLLGAPALTHWHSVGPKREKTPTHSQSGFLNTFSSWRQSYWVRWIRQEQEVSLVPGEEGVCSDEALILLPSMTHLSPRAGWELTFRQSALRIWPEGHNKQGFSKARYHCCHFHAQQS